jgi:sec-independent protein translocase protein TatA
MRGLGRGVKEFKEGQKDDPSETKSTTTPNENTGNQ